MNAHVAYTIGTGKLYCSLDELYSECGRLLGEPVMTHEFADHETWVRLRSALEDELLATTDAVVDS